MKCTQAYKCAHKFNKNIMKTYENINAKKMYEKKRTVMEKNVRNWRKTYNNKQIHKKMDESIQKRTKMDKNVKQCKEITTREKNLHKRIKRIETYQNIQRRTKEKNVKKIKNKKNSKKKNEWLLFLRFSNLFNKPINYSNFLVTF